MDEFGCVLCGYRGILGAFVGILGQSGCFGLF